MPRLDRMNSLMSVQALGTSLFIVLSLTPAILPASGGPLQAQAPSETASSRDFDLVTAEATFDSVWSRVRHTHYDPELQGVDWEAVREELRPQLPSARGTGEVRAILSEMLDRLGESHFSIIPSVAAPAFDRSLPPVADGDGDPGLDVRWMGGELVVTRVRAGSPAAHSGIKVGWVLRAVDDTPVDTLAAWIRDAAQPDGVERDLGTWLPRAVRARMLGREGSSVELALVDERDRQLRVRVDRGEPPGNPVVFGNLPPLRVEVEHWIEPLGGNVEAGVIRLSAWFPVVVPALAQAVDEFRNADAIVLDLRGNPGGIGALVMGIGGHFLDEALSLGTMRTRDTALEFVVNPQRVGPDGRRVEPYGGPVLILVDALTASTSEIFAAGLQALGRAVVLGETTAGQALPAMVVGLPNGDLLMHAIADFTAPDGSRLEGRGVQPEVPVAMDRASLLRDDDPVLSAALEWITENAG